MSEVDKRALIKEDIMKVLKTIKRSAGFLCDVGQVTDEIKLPEEIDVPNFPWLGFVSGDEDYPYVTNRSIETAQKPIIIGYVRGTEKVSLDTELNRLIYDVRKAVLADKKRGDADAEMTYIDSIVTDKGTFSNYGAFEMSLKVLYRELVIR